MLSERAEGWIADARIDLEAARLLSQHLIPNHAIFHARQALEKLLKAGYPILKHRPMPREHSLQAMVHEVFGRIPEPIWAIIKRLNPFYMSTRYVDAAGGPPSERFEPEDAQEAVQLAEEAFEWIETQYREKS
ncbi:MAG: HEPN domain-containing protein [Armatimonadia bacterium]|nr:HEPN domain-containing protein [Armatimonadia bacterium]